MSIQWSREQILALAPDSAAAQAARGLTNLRTWSNLGQQPQAIWGECQGSGAKPYQTVIDLSEPAFKCSCPSRKFPCKHALALFLLAAADLHPFALISPPAWAESWLVNRAKRNEAPAKAQAPKAVNEKAQAKRQAERTQKINQGVAELQLWLGDLVRSGFADLPTRPNAFWQQTAARLIDAQAPGLAAQVQALGQIVAAGEGWAERLTAALARLHLLLQAWSRLAALPPATQQEVRTLIGWSQSKEEVLAIQPVVGRWAVMSVRNEINATLIQQRIWLQQCETGRPALILNFAPLTARQTLELHWRTGQTISAHLHFYTSPTPLRALVSALQSSAELTQRAHATSIRAGLQHYQAQLVHNPWLNRFPLLLDQVVVLPAHTANNPGDWWVCDRARQALPISRRCKAQPWLILSLTGGAPAQLFGEWCEDGFFPLGLWSASHYHALPPFEEVL